MTQKELNKKMNDYWRYLKSALNVLFVNNTITDSQYNTISKKIDQNCGKEIKNGRNTRTTKRK